MVRHTSVRPKGTIQVMPESGTEMSRMVDRRMALAREWDGLVAQVREIEGFEDFLQSPPLEKLLPAADKGPVAVINVSQWRCDALLVTPDGVQAVELPALTAGEVERRVAEYVQVLHVVGRRTREYWLAWQRVDEGERSVPALNLRDQARSRLGKAEYRVEAMLRAILGWLWETIAEPVLRALGFTDTPPDGTEWPRLWWCPTGLLTLLPLHAAGDHAVEGQPRPTVLDRVVSSYTPTLRALVEARSAAKPDADAQLLLVTIADAPGEVPLKAVAAERDMLTRLFAGRHTLLDGSQATVAQVRAQLPGHQWIHFSCHGDQILDDPSRGGLRLIDDTLTIADISAGQYKGDFAFLSACKTATGGVSLADEAITLAAALHYTGYRHVIGTLWSVFDTTAATVAEAVYATVGPGGEFVPDESAVRLHQIVRSLRDTQRLSVWTPFTHTGP